MKRISNLILILILGWVLYGCTGLTAKPNPPLQMTDGLGRLVTLEKPAQKIVSLAPSNTEILFAIGAGKQVFGRDDFSDYPVEAKSISSIGGIETFNSEAIVSLQPDLVLAAGINSKEQVKSLENLKITVFYLSNPTEIEGLYTNINTVGKLTGHEKEALTLNDSLQKRVAAVDARISKTNGKPGVFYELDATDPSKPWTAGPGTFMDLLIKRAGGTNIGQSLTSSWAQISQEAVVMANPDIIILGDGTYGVTVQSVKSRPGWETIKAVKNQNIYLFNDDLVSRPGPRLIDGLEALALLIHPK